MGKKMWFGSPSLTRHLTINQPLSQIQQSETRALPLPYDLQNVPLGRVAMVKMNKVDFLPVDLGQVL